jgi:hypothetical protein
MRIRKNILLTFDYELFLGKRSGSVQKCMIEPTNELLKILKKNNAKAIFFIDTTYLAQLELVSVNHPKAKKDLETIIAQIKEIVTQGHYIFHHLHPHWLDAIYLENSNEWNLENTKRFAIFNIHEKERDELFAFSSNFLTGIYKSVGSDLIPDGYRAGGLFIEPFSCFKTHFEKYGIHYEFSVVPGEKKDGTDLFYDFSSVQINKPYSFNDELTVEDPKGKLIEFPISKIEIKGLTKLLNSVYYRMNKKSLTTIPFGDGLSVGSKINSNKQKKKLTDYLKFELAISIEMLNPALILAYKRIIAQNEFIHFLSHPKLLSKGSLNELDKLLRNSHKKYQIQYDFKKMINH